jgi:hypothetical protein
MMLARGLGESAMDSLSAFRVRDRSTLESIVVGAPFERDRVARRGDPGSPRARRPARVESGLSSIETNSLVPHEVRVVVPWRSVRSFKSRCRPGSPSSRRPSEPPIFAPVGRIRCQGTQPRGRASVVSRKSATEPMGGPDNLLSGRRSRKRRRRGHGRSLSRALAHPSCVGAGDSPPEPIPRRPVHRRGSPHRRRSAAGGAISSGSRSRAMRLP